jgi:hypothetical protein
MNKSHPKKIAIPAEAGISGNRLSHVHVPVTNQSAKLFVAFFERKESGRKKRLRNRNMLSQGGMSITDLMRFSFKITIEN